MKRLLAKVMFIAAVLACMPLSSAAGTIDDLKTLLGQISLTSYKAGTDPGCIIDATIVDRLTTACANAQAALETATEEEAKDLYDELKAAKDAADAAETVGIEDGGYYYFYTAFPGYVSGENADYAWYAPHDTHVGCTHFVSGDPCYIWQVKVIETVDGVKHYSIYNVGCGVYVNRGDDTSQEASINYSTFQVTPQVFKQLNRAGQWNVGNTLDPLPYNPAWNGNIVLYPGGENSGSAWFVRKVPDIVKDSPNMSSQKLLNYLETFPSDITQMYMLGTEPGYVNDETKYNNFIDVYDDACTKAGNASEEESASILQKLQEAKAAVDAPEANVPLADGYYYITTANSAFINADKGDYALTSPFDKDNNVGWKALEKENGVFIWKVTITDNASDRKECTIQNVGSSLFLSQGALSQYGSTIITSAESSASKQLIWSVNHAGQWLMSNATDYEKSKYFYYQSGHADGQGTSGKLVLGNGDIDSPTAWYFRPVPQDIVENVTSNEGLNRLQLTLKKDSDYLKSLEVSAEPGYLHNQALKDKANELLAKATRMLGETGHTNSEFVQVNDEIVQVMKEAKESLDSIPDGYYRIQSRYYVFHNNDNDAYLCLNNGDLGWKHLVPQSADFVWKVEARADSGYTVRNARNGKYIIGTNGPKVVLGDEAGYAILIANIMPRNNFSISDTRNPTFSYYLYGDNFGTNYKGIIGITDVIATAGQNNSWALCPVSDEEVSSMLASQAQTDLNIVLGDKIRKVRRLYYNETTPAIGEPLIKESSQIFSNNSSDAWGDLGALIDNSFDTHWSSAYDVQKEDAPHYIGFHVEEGLPDTVVIQYCSRQNPAVHRLISYLRVQVSDDGVSWNSLPWDYTSEDLHTPVSWGQVNMQQFQFCVEGLKGHKYVRFVCLASENEGVTPYFFNNHPVMDYAEFRLYPFAGAAPESVSQGKYAKKLTGGLLDALLCATNEYISGKATQATIEALDQATGNYKNGSRLDSLIAASTGSADNLPVGDKIGEFPQSVIDTYNATISDLTNTLEQKGDNITAEEIVACTQNLKQAVATLEAGMNKPAEGKWYAIFTASSAETAANHVVSATSRSFGYNQNGRYSYFTAAGTIESIYESPEMLFTFHERPDGYFDIQNVASGAYFGPDQSIISELEAKLEPWYTSYPIKIVPLDNGKVALRSKAGFYLNVNANNPATVYFANYNGYPQDEGFAWSIELPEEFLQDDALMDEIQDNKDKSVPTGGYCIITKHYDLNGLPFDESGNMVPGYEIVGQVKAKDGQTVRAYKLRKLDEGAMIKAGTPVIYYLDGDAGGSAGLIFSPLYNGAVNMECDTANGLCGSPDYITLPSDAAVINGDSVTLADNGASVNGERGFIIPALVREIEGAPVDALLYASGSGVPVSIKDINAPSAVGKVNVYTVDGIEVKHGVDASRAAEKLKKAYIL